MMLLMYFTKTTQSRCLESKGRYNEDRRAPTEQSVEQEDTPRPFSNSVAEPIKACLVPGDV